MGSWVWVLRREKVRLVKSCGPLHGASCAHARGITSPRDQRSRPRACVVDSDHVRARVSWTAITSPRVCLAHHRIAFVCFGSALPTGRVVHVHPYNNCHHQGPITPDWRPQPTYKPSILKNTPDWRPQKLTVRFVTQRLTVCMGVAFSKTFPQAVDCSCPISPYRRRTRRSTFWCVLKKMVCPGSFGVSWTSSRPVEVCLGRHHVPFSVSKK